MDENKLKTIYVIKIEQNWVEKFTDDGIYHENDELKDAIKFLNLAKEKYVKFDKIKVIDNQKLLTNNSEK